MQSLFWLTIAYRFGDEAVRLHDLEDSSQHALHSQRPNCSSSSPVRTEPASLLLLPPARSGALGMAERCSSSFEAVASAGACTDSRRSSGMAARRGHEMRYPELFRMQLV
jgi:hypothetical protein